MQTNTQYLSKIIYLQVRKHSWDVTSDGLLELKLLGFSVRLVGDLTSVSLWWLS